MIPLSLDQIARITGARLDQVADPGTVVHGPVVIDSRRVLPGGLFAAVRGERADGHDFAPAAVAGGAVAVLASRPVAAPALVVGDVPAALAALARAVVDQLPRITIAGITGSSGKTTTKDLTAQLAERLGPTVAPEGSYNNELGQPLTVLRADEQTRYMVLELAARGAGHIATLCRIAPPHLGAVLNVGHAHAGEFGGLDEIAGAKGELPEALPPDGVAVLNADDWRVAAMAGRTAARVVTFSMDEATGASAAARPPEAGETTPGVRAAGMRLDGLGRPAFTLEMASGSAPVQLALHGVHNAANALAAAALAAEMGMSVADIAAGLSAATARSKWRMEVRQRADGVTVINDAYNANPESVRAALDALAHMSRGRRSFAILGHMAELGELSRASHEEAGALAARAGLAGLIAVGEEAEPILLGARAQRAWRGEAIGVPDGPGAVAAIRAMLEPGDVVLVKASRAAALESVAAELLSEHGPGGSPAGSTVQ